MKAYTLNRFRIRKNFWSMFNIISRKIEHIRVTHSYIIAHLSSFVYVCVTGVILECYKQAIGRKVAKKRGAGQHGILYLAVDTKVFMRRKK